MANVIQVSFELIYFKCFLNLGINLDQRIKMPEWHRFKGYICYTILSCIAIIVLFKGIVPKINLEPCPIGTYNNQSSTICSLCNYTLGNNCLSCTNGLNCTSCSDTFYLDVGKCFSCNKLFDGCQLCKKNICNVCSQGYYILNGKCNKCSQVVGCNITSCSNTLGC